MNAAQPAPAVIVLGPSGLATARRTMTVFPQAELHGFAKRVAQADVHFDDTAQHLGALFLAGRPIIALTAAGIVIRCLAPHLGDKKSEPPVIALAEDGRHVVPLLGGHRGANRMAAQLAEALGGTAAITTAGELSLGFALDDPPEGWRAEPSADVKKVTAALLAGEAVALKPGAERLMLLEPAGALNEGSQTQLTLTFEHAAPVTVTAQIRSAPHGSCGGLRATANAGTAGRAGRI